MGHHLLLKRPKASDIPVMILSLAHSRHFALESLLRRQILFDVLDDLFHTVITLRQKWSQPISSWPVLPTKWHY